MTLQSIPGIGEFFSATSAILWALSLVLFRRAGDSMAPSTLNLYKGTVALACLIPTMALLGIDFFPDDVTIQDWLIMLASGMAGMGIADTILFISLNKVGPGRYAIINCSFGPATILASAVFLGEPVTAALIGAAALIVAAILLSAWDPVGRMQAKAATPDPNRPRLWRYYLLGVLGVVIIAVSIVAAKPILNRTDGVWGAFARLCGGLLFLVPQNLMPRNFKRTVAAFSRGPHHRHALLPSFLGAYACTVLWTLGMKYTYASVASVLCQLTNILLFPFAFLILKDRIQARQIVAVGIGIGAGLLIILAN